MQTLSRDPAPPLGADAAESRAAAGGSIGRPTWRAGRGVDLLIGGALVLLALAVRWPYLWTVPRFTDETLEVLHSLAIVRDGTRPLTNYDTYYGALYNYVIAAALWLVGESPLAPRLVVLIAGALTVAATYALGRELAGRVLVQQHPHPSPLPEGEGTNPLSLWERARVRDWLLPHLVGALAALLLVVNGPHVVINSHIAWSNCLTPLFTALACWMLLRGGGPSLALAGLLFGLALQTHPLVAALLPGAAAYVAWRHRALWRTVWPYLGAALFLVGYGNVLLYNWETGFESLRSAGRIRAEYASDQQATVGYLPTLGTMLLMLARILGGAVDQRAGPAEYLLDPALVVACTLAVVGLVWAARRGELLPLLLVASFLLLLPALNPKFRTLVTSRYLMPLVPLLFALVAVSLVHGARALLEARAGWLTGGRRRAAVGLGAGVIAFVLVVAPLASLGRYYARAFERSDTNERIWRLGAEIAAARGPKEVVLIDEGMGTELPDTGVTEVRGFEHLLNFARVPYRSVRPTPGRLQDELRAVPSALVVLNARDAAAAGERLAVTPLDPRPAAQTGRAADYRLYRLSLRRSAASYQPLTADR